MIQRRVAPPTKKSINIEETHQTSRAAVQKEEDDDKNHKRRKAKKQLDRSMKCVHIGLGLIVLAYVVFLAEESDLESRYEKNDSDRNNNNNNLRRNNEVVGNTLIKNHHPIRSKRSNRFPKYGTEEFNRQCPWVEVTDEQVKNCTVFFRPPGKTTEGLSSWVGLVAQNFLVARQAGCQIKFDYGKDVNIYDTLSPFPNAHPYNNWIIPKDFECLPENNCFNFRQTKEIEQAAKLEYPLQHVPIYRHIYKPIGRKLYSHNTFKPLEQRLPHFQLETGMACALGGLFHLPSSLSNYEPDLFTSLLPKLQDKQTLVMSLYIRTGHTDVMALEEEKHGKVDYHNSEGGSRSFGGYAKCALHLEQEYLSGRIDTNNDGDDSSSLTIQSISRILWLIVTDSPKLKSSIKDQFDGKSIVPPIVTNNNNKNNITREVIGSRSLGIHSRTTRNISKSDFADSFLDWFLIGESDMVIDKLSAYTFGETGSLRTARPVYNIKTNPCSKITFIKDD